MMVRTLLLTIVVLLALLVSTLGHPPPRFNTLSEFCAHMDARKDPDADREAMKRCRDEIVPKEQREDMNKCKAIMNFDDKAASEEYCKSPDKHEPKFQEMKACMQKEMEKHKPDPEMRAKFHDCMEKAKTKSK
ncbi:uncharacterized protein LOC141851701 [Brevipalpus obovatus]|uniref:uncharacterized protein LOC141851701 n=1 Tax=Brevipalpus obovatus TaxID=246614 RepID=UPI003D9E33B5